MAIAALICGILGIVGGFIPVVQYFTFVLSILGIIFGVKARKEISDKRGLATAGMICGIVGAAVSGIGAICALCAIGSLGALGASMSGM